jgi:hypothetical protein
MPKTTEPMNGVPTGEAARRLNLSPTRIGQLAASGKLAYTQTALGRLFDPAAIDALAAERAQKREGR